MSANCFNFWRTSSPDSYRRPHWGLRPPDPLGYSPQMKTPVAATARGVRHIGALDFVHHHYMVVTPLPLSVLRLYSEHSDWQARFYVGQGAIASKPQPCPKYFGWRLTTVTQHQHRCKKERSVAFKICQNAFSAGPPPLTSMGLLTTIPQAL